MKIPNKIKIVGKTFTVEIRDRLKEDGSDRLGSILYGQQKIIIDSSILEEAKDQTLLHEIVEGIINLFDLEIEHKDLSILSEALYAVLKDNKLRF